MHNIYGDLKTVKFVEFFRPTASSNWVRSFFFQLAEGYEETDSLIATLQNKFTNTSGSEITRESDGSTTVQHTGQTDTPTTVTLSHSSSTHKNTLLLDSGTQHKAIALFVEDQNVHTLWESLGFPKHTIVKRSELPGIVARLNTLAAGAGADVIASDAYLGGSKTIRGCLGSSAQVDRTLTSPHAGTFENHNGCTSQKRSDKIHCMPSPRRLKCYSPPLRCLLINNDVPKFSHLTYHTDMPMWNLLPKSYYNAFDIEIRDHKGHLFPRSAIANFVLQLVLSRWKR